MGIFRVFLWAVKTITPWLGVLLTTHFKSAQWKPFYFAPTKELFVSYNLHKMSFCINFETRFSPVFVQIFFSLVLYRVISKLRQSELGLLRLISRFRWLGFCFFFIMWHFIIGKKWKTCIVMKETTLFSNVWMICFKL